MFDKIKLFIQESRQEFKRVNWPRREETVRYTMFVITFSIGFALFLGLLDFMFVRILEKAVLY